MPKNKSNSSTKNSSNNSSKNSSRNQTSNSVKDSHAQVPDNSPKRSGPGGE